MLGKDSSWQLDETYVKVKGKWFYLCRAINKLRETLDFYFSRKRDHHSAYQFLKRCMRYYSNTLNIDKHALYGHAITRLKCDSNLRQDIQQRQIDLNVRNVLGTGKICLHESFVQC